jgi:site-specific DNA-methyltransferase (adenine-specific)
MAITQLTALTTRRSVYCSKRANGKHSIATVFNDEEGSIWFKRTEHTWTGGAQKVITVDENGKEIEKKLGGKCKHCGASQSEYERDKTLESHAYALIHTEDPKKLIEEVFGEEMQFDVIIGNPPYQLDDGGFGASAAPIYHKFVDQAKALEPRMLAMVIPARWYAGGKGLDAFRTTMIEDRRVRELHDFPDSSQVFPGVQIKGGVCFFLWEKDFSGDCRVVRYSANVPEHESVRPLAEKGSQIFVRYGEAISILRKIAAIETGSDKNGESIALPEEKQFKALVSARKPFGLQTNFKGDPTPKPGSLPVYQNGGLGYVAKDTVPSSHPLLNVWKIFVSGAYGAGNSFPHSVLGKPFLGSPGTLCTETYLAIGPFSSEQEAESAMTYVQTKFFRFLVLQNKPAQHATRGVYSLVPRQVLTQPWSDDQLYKRYSLEKAEIDFIEKMIRPMGEEIE